MATKRAYMRERGWREDDWYRAWSSTDLVNEIESACREYKDA